MQDKIIDEENGDYDTDDIEDKDERDDTDDNDVSLNDDKDDDEDAIQTWNAKWSGDIGPRQTVPDHKNDIDIDL